VGHPRADALDLLIVEVEHEGRWPLFDDAPEDAELHYTNSFKAISAEKTYRPPRRTPRPRIHGVVTGIVQPLPGADVGAVARLDEHGRYVVQIHFDTAPPGGQKASHAVRMAQPYAGPNHGMHFPLRPGAEVLLGFVDGDPDRPIILGAVPNAIAPSPVAAANANTHRISTAAGVVIEISDRH
jgi:type VI secretion system secreted protein VgrG